MTNVNNRLGLTAVSLVAALTFMSEVEAATIAASSCSQANVSSAIATAQSGDVVQVPAGSCSWSGLTLAKPISLVGAGVGRTNITISNELTVQKQTGGLVRVSDFSFTRNGSGSATIGIRVTGAWTSEPVIFQRNNFNVTNATLFRVQSAGGFIFSNNSVNAGWDDIIFQLKDDSGIASWQTADTLGARDTTGKRNHYIENNTIYGGTNTTVDCDDGARCVYRYNTVTYSGFGSHGYATSPIGVRHFEIYNNTWQYPTSGCSSQLANQNWLARLRGGTGVVFNNAMPDIAVACGWGDKPEVRLDLRGAEDVRPQGSCSQVKYPVPRQIGQNHNGTSYFTDPVYIWGNARTPGMGLGWGWGNPCGLNWNDFVREGRDYVLGTAKPGYTPYTYPHPLLNVVDGGTPPSPPPVDTTAPTTPGTPTTANITSTGLTLNWTASTDAVGVTGYRVERCTGSSCTTFAQVGTPTTNSYTDSALTAATTYRYRVRATDAMGNLSGYSNVVNGTTGPAGGLSALPEGNSGIAANYINDNGIAANSLVLFADGFDSYASLSQLTSSGNWDNYYGNLALDTTTYFGGTKSLRIRMPSSGSEISNAIHKDLDVPQDRVFVRVYTRMQANYAGINSAHNGVAVTANYLGAGVKPNGTNHFIVGVENSRWLSEAEPGYTNAYVYHPEQNDTYGEHWYPNGFTNNGDGPNGGFGAYFVSRPNVSLPRGQWVAFEIMIQANTPGSRDGRIAVWQDGVLIADWQNVRLRDTGTLKIDEVRIDNGGQGSSQQNDKWYDNVVIATSYIGPMVTGTPAAPPLPSPANLRVQ